MKNVAASGVTVEKVNGPARVEPAPAAVEADVAVGNVVVLRLAPQSDPPEFVTWREARASWDTLTLSQRWESSFGFLQWLAEASTKPGYPIERYRSEAQDVYNLTGELMQWAKRTQNASRRAEQAAAVGRLIGHGVLAGIEVLAQRTADAVATKLAQQAPLVQAPASSDAALTSDLFEQWKREAGGVSAAWWQTRAYHFASITRHFGTVAGLMSEALHVTFKRDRLQAVSRGTHKKERSTLASLFEWLETKPWGFRAVALPRLGKKDRGTRDVNRKAASVDMSEAEVEALIVHLPVATSRARREGTPIRPIRDAVLVEWDTGLRPITIERLSVPEHWQTERPGELFISAAIDKEEYERTIPLTPRLAALFARRAAKLPNGRGLLFGEYQRALRPHWYKAAKAAGIDERRANKISVYDFRHAAGKRFLDATGNIRGTAFMLGHKNATSTHRYTKPDKPAADRLVDALERPQSSVSTNALDPARTDEPASERVLDEAQGSEYTSLPTRERGGIGRRTRFRF